MRHRRRGGGSGLEFGGSGEDSFVAVVVTKLTGALLFILLLTMVIMALLPKAVDMAPPGGKDSQAGSETPPAPLEITTPEALPEAIAGPAVRRGPRRHGRPRAAPLDAGRADPRRALVRSRLRDPPGHTRAKGTPQPLSLAVRVSDGAEIATRSTRLLVYQSDQPLVTPAWWKPGLPPVPWRAWLDQGVGFLVLWLVHLVGMATLANLERSSGEGSLGLDGDDAGAVWSATGGSSPTAS